MTKNNKIERLIVIGDRLNHFSNHESIIRISELEKLVNSALEIKQDNKYIIHIGQGVSEKRLNKLITLISNDKLSDIFNLQFSLSHKKSNSQLTHKRKSKNIMISDPLQKKEDEYCSTLMLDDSCAEMSDHVTGEHIQGMILAEAARQMVVAVTEKYFIDKNASSKVNFVTHGMDMKFYQFIFPLCVTINYKIIEMRKAYKNNLTSRAIISFTQNNVLSAEINFNFSTLDSKYIAEKEYSLAKEYINSYLNKSKHNIVKEKK